MSRSKYQLIAIDMDGTLLNSQKQISEVTNQSLIRANEKGKICVIATGRSISELIPYQKEITNFKYGICESGALVYNFETKQVLSKITISPDISLKILEAVSNEDVMIQTMSDGIARVNESQIPIMEKYNMGVYKSLYDKTATKVDDITEYIKNDRDGFEKINIYFCNSETRQKVYEKISNLPISIAFAEISNLELSSLNVSKGNALEFICNHLKIPITDTIAIGDAPNDTLILKKAGLSIAMGNAFPEIKKLCSIIVADNDHDGCAEAINKYLLVDSKNNS